MNQELQTLLNEINTRIELGDQSNGHLEYVQTRLQEILDAHHMAK